MRTISQLTPTARRPVAGYILASIAVGVVGLITAIVITVTGIMNSFASVSESYADVWESGIEVGPQPTEVELDVASYALLTFSDEDAGPGALYGGDACDITGPDGSRAVVDLSAQPLTSSQRAQAPRDLGDAVSVVFRHFEARSGTYLVRCDTFGLLSDGRHDGMGGTEMRGVLIGLGSLMVAGGFFVMGVVNSSRNKTAQAARLG